MTDLDYVPSLQAAARRVIEKKLKARGKDTREVAFLFREFSQDPAKAKILEAQARELLGQEALARITRKFPKR